MNKFWFNTWKLIWHAYVDLHMWMLNEQIMIRCLKTYLMTCLCWFANVIIEWTNCDSMLGTLLNNMLMLICTCGCQMNKIVIRRLNAYSMTCLCWFAHVYVKCTNYDSTLRSLFDNMSICTCRCQMNKLWFNTCKPIQHAYVNLHILNEQIVHLTWILFPHVLSRWTNFRSMCFHYSWDVEWTPFLYLWKRSQKNWQPGDLTLRFMWWACDWEASDRKLILLIRACWA